MIESVARTKSYCAVEWKEGHLRYLDQRKLPREERYVEATTESDVAEAIRSLAIRGAPLIGIAAAYGIVLAVQRLPEDADPAMLRVRVERALTLLGSTRPTAANLFWALDRMRKVFDRVGTGNIETLRSRLLDEAMRIHREDEEQCRRIGEFGTQLLPLAATVLTHCNTGGLATGGIGTAQGILATAWRSHKLKHVYVDETRPLFQGARLTAWELSKLHIPFTLITDSTAPFLMQRGIITAIIVGADRIARNGDTANKIGTYGLAVLAHHHGIPFYVAAPRSTIDPAVPDGEAIPIEQRSADEVTRPFGLQLAPDGVDVYSPAFDITPHGLISAIITEAGVVKPPYEFLEHSRGA
jgi:methylthioribose-1-phosphate isomerase